MTWSELLAVNCEKAFAFYSALFGWQRSDAETQSTDTYQAFSCDGRMIGAMQDITQMKENELRVLQQNEKLTEIALINAHEIRKPVATILGLVQLIDEDVLKTADDRQVLTHLKASAAELDEVIKRIIDKTIS